jgi:excisionase family DNA binding protein
MSLATKRREEIQGAGGNGHKQSELLTPEQLAEKLKVPILWIYEQSRQKKIPTHRLGRYIRFSLSESVGKPEKELSA